MLPGDAASHIGIARRVFDSLTPGPFQLGTVWLPLQHLLTIPFILSDHLWRTGVGGSGPSLAGYVLAVTGVFRVIRTGLDDPERPEHSAAAAWFGALLFALNPNLLYVQSTALNESLYLAEFVWAVAFLSDFRRFANKEAWDDSARALRRCGMVLAAAILTRYDGWFLGGLCGLALIVSIALEARIRESLRSRQSMQRGTLAFFLLPALTAMLWLAYNYGIFHDPLEFARGPYSAIAIMKRSMRPGDPFHPGYHSLRVAALYFLKCAKLNVAQGRWEPWLLLLAVLGTFFAGMQRRWAWLLLWTPVPFYAISVAYSGVPIFIPVWWPFSYYNARYGLQLLPAMCVFTAAAMAWLMRVVEGKSWRMAVPIVFVAVSVGSYASEWIAQPICLREAVANSRTRIPYEKALAEQLDNLPANARLMMFVGGHFDALRRADIPFRRVLNESNYPLWQIALDDPAGHADYVIAMEGGPVEKAVKEHPAGLESILVLSALDQPRTTFYKSRTATRR